MKLKLSLCVALSIVAVIWFAGLVNAGNQHVADIEDNDFAEFEEFDDEGV